MIPEVRGVIAYVIKVGLKKEVYNWFTILPCCWSSEWTFWCRSWLGMTSDMVRRHISDNGSPHAEHRAHSESYAWCHRNCSPDLGKCSVRKSLRRSNSQKAKLLIIRETFVEKKSRQMTCTYTLLVVSIAFPQKLAFLRLDARFRRGDMTNFWVQFEEALRCFRFVE